jgi:hypothetical protein
VLLPELLKDGKVFFVFEIYFSRVIGTGKKTIPSRPGRPLGEENFSHCHCSSSGSRKKSASGVPKTPLMDRDDYQTTGDSNNL